MTEIIYLMSKAGCTKVKVIIDTCRDSDAGEVYRSFTWPIAWRFRFCRPPVPSPAKGIPRRADSI